MKTSKSNLHAYISNIEEAKNKVRTGLSLKPFIIILFLGIILLSSCIFIPFRGGGGHRGDGGGERHEHHDRGDHR